MRDIRIDLQERARLIEDQISASYAQFEKMIEQLQSERESRVSELKSELAALSKHRRMANVLPLSDFIMHRLNEAGVMSKDDIVSLTLNEGYFADAESADRGVQASLVTLHRNEHIRQIHDGTFAPATLIQTIRFRRAI
jgi:hypothetical protein